MENISRDPRWDNLELIGVPNFNFDQWKSEVNRIVKITTAGNVYERQKRIVDLFIHAYFNYSFLAVAVEYSTLIIEDLVRQIADCHGVKVKKLHETINILSEKMIISKENSDILHKIRNLRNALIHSGSPMVLPPSMALNLVESILIGINEVLSKQPLKGST